MGAIADLWKSERGLICVVLIIAATVLCAIRVLEAQQWDQWSSFVKWVFITYTAGKTVTGTAQVLKGGTADPETAAPATPATPAESK